MAYQRVDYLALLMDDLMVDLMVVMMVYLMVVR